MFYHQELLKDVKIYPKNVENGMLSQLIRRPFWCISRQRMWGVPIPVLYNKETGEPLVNKKLVDRLCELVDKSGNTDYWWTCPISEIIPEELDPENFTKGQVCIK
jgi:isoleucyl-tRNA synthetase